MKSSHGSLKSYTIKSVQTQGRKKGFSPAGWVGFMIDTKYSNGVEGEESINFYRAEKDGAFLVTAHQIQTPILKALAEKQQATRGR